LHSKHHFGQLTQTSEFNENKHPEFTWSENMKIKHLSKLGAVALALCSLQVMAQTGPSVTVGTASGQVGSATPVVIPITYDGDGTVVGFQFEFTYDSTNLTADISNCGGALGGQTTQCSESVAGTVLLLAFDSTFTAIPSGSLGSISFDISAAPIADYPLTVQNEAYGDASEGDVPSTGSTNGLVQVTAGPQPLFATTPSAVALSGQISTTLQTDVVIDNDGGDDGSTLNYTCTVPAGKFTLSGDTTAFAVPKGNTGTVTVACDSSVIGGPFADSMACTHDGSNASPVNVALSCTVTAGPEPAYTGVAAGLAMVATEQGDPDPAGSVTITNTGDATTTLTGSCAFSVGDPQITLTNGEFSVAEGTAGNVVGVACDASLEGPYTATLSCSHNGTNVASPVDYAVTCDVGPPGPAVYLSAPASGAVIDMTATDVPVGAVVPDQVLTITNDAAEANDRDLALMGCAWAGSAEITATAPTTPVAAQTSTSVTFSCSTAAVGVYTGTYSCPYDLDGNNEPDGTATYTVNCGVRAAASDILESPVSGTALNLLVPILGTAQTSVSFAEILDEGVDATVDTCSFGTANFSVISTLPATVSAGGTVAVTVSGTDPVTGELTFTDTLTCTYTDTDSDPGTASWPITLTVLAQPIPTLSTWGLMLMILTMMGLGGIVIRRKVRS
jgi:hypothetical protein